MANDNIMDFRDMMVSKDDLFKAELVKLLYMTRNTCVKKPSSMYSFKKPLCYMVSQIRRQNEMEFRKARDRYGQECKFLYSRSQYTREILPWLFKMNSKAFMAYLPSTYKDCELNENNELNIIEYALI